MKRLALTAVAAVMAVTGGVAHAQAPNALVTGWNLVKPINCVFVPGSPAVPAAPNVPATAANPDVFWLDVSVISAPQPPGQPPPPPDQASFNTNDPVAIGIAAPFCISGGQFYVYWNGTKALYFSLYPGL